MTEQTPVEPAAPRSESVIFGELRELCSKPGYAHALAFVCVHDQALFHGNSFSAKDLEPGYDTSRLIRTEISVLTGLWVQSDRDVSLPESDTIEAYIAQTYELLEEMHDALNVPNTSSLSAMMEGTPKVDPLTQGTFLREAIFYAPASAYFFQFRDLAPIRYAQDADWLRKHRCFTADEAQAVSRAIAALLDIQLKSVMKAAAEVHNKSGLLLPAIKVRPEHVAAHAKMDAPVVEAVFNALSTQTRNEGFNAVDDYNEVNAFPLVPWGDGSFVVFDMVAIYQSLYESPIFWMREDKAYAETATQHRGAFTESVARDFLTRSFGTDRIFTNVSLLKGKEKVGEIDVLVVFGDRLIIVEAKSKGLTIRARKGSDLHIQEDFESAVEKAYGQALECAQHLIVRDVDFALPNGTALKIPDHVQEIFPVCLVADHYPSLSTQARTSLRTTVTDVIRAPFVMDIFLLDAMTEMLSTPLRLLNYMHQHAKAVDRVAVLHELTWLSSHLQINVPGDEFDQVYLDESISGELDAAMMVRRLGLPGDATPKGILTVFAGTPFDRLISQLEHEESAAAIELGLLLLTLSSDTVGTLNEGIRRLCELTLLKGGRHDFSVSLVNGSGITVHVSAKIDDNAREILVRHGSAKKHQLKSDEWFVVLLDPQGNVHFAAVTKSPWEPSEEMDKVVAALAAQGPQKRVGVNDPCPCGSGKKYKRCHMWR